MVPYCMLFMCDYSCEIAPDIRRTTPKNASQENTTGVITALQIAHLSLPTHSASTSLQLLSPSTTQSTACTHIPFEFPPYTQPLERQVPHIVDDSSSYCLRSSSSLESDRLDVQISCGGDPIIEPAKRFLPLASVTRPFAGTPSAGGSCNPTP